jgi:uncharacterized membrane protein
LDEKTFICFDDPGQSRKGYVGEVLQDAIGELSALDKKVIERLHEHQILLTNISKQFQTKLIFREGLNPKAELEIRHLHEKIDHLLGQQYNRRFQIQQIQIELLQELRRKKAVAVLRARPCRSST